MNINQNTLVSNFPELITADEAIEDYRLMYRSRQASLIGRKEVLTGKAKFGIFGDGKELAQIAMAKVFRNGDVRSGYYRDQTFAYVTGIMTIKQFFAQLFANPDVELEPHSAGRQMNNHLASRMLHADGSWKNISEMKLSSADVSCTGSQMPRLVGLAQASKLYRLVPELADQTQFSHNGNEVVFGTIGNASCAEGMFWEAINALGVIKAPMIMSIWDDDYGISVPNEFQITKSNISELLKGFQREDDSNGYEIFVVKGWDYVSLLETYGEAERIAREEHVPCIIHVIEMTQPQGHSTSGSHERYKSSDRLEWEAEHDCMLKMRNWLTEKKYATDEELKAWEKEDRKLVRKWKNEAWKEYQHSIKVEIDELLTLFTKVIREVSPKEEIRKISDSLQRITEPTRRDFMVAAHKALIILNKERNLDSVKALRDWRRAKDEEYTQVYDSHLRTESEESPLLESGVPALYSEDSPAMNGFEILNKFFDIAFERDPRLLAFGEDVGQLGDVNQGFAGLQAKYGKLRIADTGIRETTIIGQAIGLAMRGLRPIAEIQYLDYLLYALQIMSDDLASLAYRTHGGQKAPAIIRTRGHRLEGIWHAGSPMGMIIHALRGMHICVPRNMTQAAGLYQTLLAGDEPALVVEVLNGYRLKEKLPDNLGEFSVALGVPELIREGTDITLVTYGACCRIALEAAKELESFNISLEVIDVQTLLPFDLHGVILESLKKTSRIIFMDEDVPGGATSYMLQQVLEKQQGYFHLDSTPITLTAKEHRSAYGTDGDYWSKPQKEHVFRAAYNMMNEFAPDLYPEFF